MDWKGAVDCPVQPDRVGFMTDRDVAELVSEDLFPVVLTDFTPHTRQTSLRFISGEFRRASVDAEDGRGQGGSPTEVTPTNAAATSCRRLRVLEGE